MLRRFTTAKFDRLNVLRHIALATCLATTGCGGADASGTPQTDTGSKVEPAGPDPVVPTPTPTPPQASAKKTIASINLSAISYYAPERILVNLIAGSKWNVNWSELPEEKLSPDGMPIALAANEEATIMLGRPMQHFQGNNVTVKCTYTGEGRFDVRGAKGGTTKTGRETLEFEWPGNVPEGYIGVRYPNPSAPVRNLECRESSRSRDEIFEPEFVESIRPYSVLRFMDWQNINPNMPITWAKRRLPGNVSQVGRDGMAIEYMIDLSNQASADAWFSVPWNADDAYVRNFAILVRDRLAKDRKVYVELGNEVWNYMFTVTHQALAEGEARNLNPENKWYGTLQRYSQKSAEVLKIWTEVFAAEPQRLVRVVSTQHFGEANSAELVLGFPGTAQYVDALATAPYFGHDLFKDERAQERNLDVLMPILAASAKSVIEVQGTRVKSVADKYKKRFIAYEAGQHVMNADDVSIIEKLNRDPRMYDIYRQYVADWKALTGDTIAFYNSGGGISKYGAWGIREYSGQPLSETPKRRAVLDFIAAGN